MFTIKLIRQWIPAEITFAVYSPYHWAQHDQVVHARSCQATEGARCEGRELFTPWSCWKIFSITGCHHAVRSIMEVNWGTTGGRCPGPMATMLFADSLCNKIWNSSALYMVCRFPVTLYHSTDSTMTKWDVPTGIYIRWLVKRILHLLYK